MKIIDAHAHIGYFGGFFDVGITAQDLVRQMDEYKIEKTVISALPNSETKKAIAEFPDRLIGTVWVNPFDGEKAVKEVNEAITNWGFKGVKLHPLLHAFVANDPVVHPIAKVAQELDVPLFIHSGHPPFSLPWPKIFRKLKWLWFIWAMVMVFISKLLLIWLKNIQTFT